jgi:WD40 repeat protein/tRNA A-37 threonylcarbamoyl transferase component Bud32
MGVVYLAQHAALGRKVAVKVLGEEQSREKLALERFFREARAAAALDHPNIVRLHDIAQSNEKHYLVMEYVEGIDLQALLDQTGPLHPAQAANYIAQAAAGLQHAHERGFIHRDIKPANLIVTRSGAVKVLDMGLARSVSDPKDSLTAQLDEEVITGTADFLSPEQALNVRLDSRTDIYSLGATFYTLLTARPPYEGSTAQKLAAHQTAPTPDVRAVRAEVPVDLAAVVGRMMAKKQGDRYQTARAVVAALDPWAPDLADTGSRETVPISSDASTPDLRQPTGQPAHPSAARALRTKRSWLIAAGIGAVLTAALLSALFGNRKPAPDPKPAGEPVAAPSPAPAPATPAALPPVNGIRWLIGHASGVNDLVVSPDETRVASVDWVGKLIIWDVRTGRRLSASPTRPDACCLSCTTTPDGQFILVAGERMPILVFEWSTGKEVREYPGHEKATWGLAVSPSGQQLLSCGGDGLVILRNLPGGDEVRRFEFEAKPVWCVAFSADGTKYAAGVGPAQAPEEAHIIRVWATADGKQLHQLTGHTGDVRAIQFRSDGGVLASGGFDGAVRLWDLGKGTEIRNIPAHDGLVERVCFLPGGRRLLTCGGPMESAKPPREGGAAKLWDAETGRELKCWQGGEWIDLICSVPSKNGRFAAAGGRDRTVRLWALTEEQ